MRRLILILLLGTLLIPMTASADTISIADARNQPLGTVVTVEGYVTVPSGVFAASTFDQGFALKDETAGIYVSIQENSGLSFNHRVRVTGTVDDDGFNLLVLRPASTDSVEKIPGASRVEAEPFATGAISEATEGLLVEVAGTVTSVTNDLPFGYSVFIDDGSGETQIFIPASTGVNPFAIPFVTVGSEIRATGYSGQFLAQYEVLPRYRGDIQQVP